MSEEEKEGHSLDPAAAHDAGERGREGGKSLDDFLKAAQSSEAGAREYEREGKLAEAAEAYASAVLGQLRYHRESGDRDGLHAAERLGRYSIEVAQKSGDETALPVPFHTLGKAYLARAHDTEDTYQRAQWVDRSLQAFEEAAKHPLPPQHDYPLFQAEMQSHIGTTMYELAVLRDDHGGLRALALQIIDDAIRGFEEPIDSQREDLLVKRDVWESGLHLRMTETLFDEGNTEGWNEHIASARAIIRDNPDPGLNLRKLDLARVERKVQGLR